MKKFNKRKSGDYKEDLKKKEITADLNKLEPLWNITDGAVKIIIEIFEKNKHHHEVKKRIRENIEGAAPPFNKELYWRKMFECLLTSQQKSDENSRIHKFINEDFNFPYQYVVDQKEHLPVLIADRLSEKGIRFGSSIGIRMLKNLNLLESGYWKELEELTNKLRHNDVEDRIYLERSVAFRIQKSIEGFGPKQVRNYLQQLGLLLYEMPIDSKIIKFFANTLGWYISSSGLSDVIYYHLVLDSVQLLSNNSSVIFQAANAPKFRH